jgi:hypothetical protein
MSYQIKPLAAERLKELGLTVRPPYVYSRTDRPAPKEYLLYAPDGVGCFPRGDIQGLAGYKKSGKSTAGIIFVSALLSGSKFGYSTPDYKPRRVLYVDTEQQSGDVDKNVSYLYKLLNWPPDVDNELLRVLIFRPYEWRERIEYLTEQVKDFAPDFVYLDGLADLCADINSSEDAPKTVQTVMTLTDVFKCAICCVLHFNKKSSDLRGHLGTALANKCSEIYEVVREFKNGNDITTVYSTCNRGDQTQPLAFTIAGTERDNDKNIVVQCAEDEQQRERDDVIAWLDKAFDGTTTPLNFAQIKSKMGIAQSNTTTVKEYIAKAERLHLVTVKDLGNGRGKGKQVTYHSPKNDFAGIDYDDCDDDVL